VLENLLAITSLVDFEDYGSLELISVESNDSGLTLSLHITTDEYPNAHPHWKVVSRGVKEHSLSLGYHHDLQFSDAHVLLLPHMAPRTSTSFYGKAEDPFSVVGALSERHREIAGDWIPFHRYLNPNIDLTELIAGGFGMLGEGPEPFILAYEDVMQQHGFSTSHLDPGKPVYAGGNELLGPKDAVFVLLLDESYVVAEEFDAIAIYCDGETEQRVGPERRLFVSRVARFIQWFF
jgi:hypothetical protein